MGEMGVLVGGLVTLIGLFTAFYKLTIEPNRENEKTTAIILTKLDAKLDSVETTQTRTSARVDKMDDEVDVIKITLARNSIS